MGNNEWLDIEILDDYLEGKLDASMMHKVERISLEDPFVAQALAGLTEAKKRTQTLSILQKQLQERVAEKPVERKMWRMASHRLSIAATAAVLFLTVSVLFWMRENQRQQQAELAANKAKNIEIDLKPQVAAAAPSVDSNIEPAATIMDKQKVEQALDKTLNKGSQAIASNRSKSAIVGSAPDPVLLDKQPAVAKFKREHTESPMSVVGPVQSAPAPPVQALESKAEGVQPQTSYATLRGKVFDYLGRPIPGANVKMVGEDARAITNSSGEFTLATDKKADKVSIEVASLGYNKKNIEAKADQNLNIRLDEDQNALSEVIVVASSRNAKKSNVAKDAAKNDSVVTVFAAGKANEMLSQPKGGWPIFEDYLKNNNKLFSNSGLSVELGFSVGKDGRPTDIKIIKGQDKALEDEAIRLLKSGPKWNYNSKLSNKAAVTIKF